MRRGVNKFSNFFCSCLEFSRSKLPIGKNFYHSKPSRYFNWKWKMISKICRCHFEDPQWYRFWFDFYRESYLLERSQLSETTKTKNITWVRCRGCNLNFQGVCQDKMNASTKFMRHYKLTIVNECTTKKDLFKENIFRF